MQNDKETNITGKIGEFVQNNRKGIFITIGAVLVMVIGLVVFLSLQDAIRKRAIVEAENLNSRYEDVRYFLNEEQYASDIETLLADLNTFAKKTKGFAGSRAWAIIAQIHSEKQEWQKAEEAWINAARVGDKTYLGPLALFNAAAAAEEQGKLEQAIEYLESCIAHPFEFPAAPRAQFSIGRLYETLNNYPAAIEAYRMVLINWQDVPVWQHLAQSKIIAIETR